jgi:hypothetical protein
MKCRKEVYAFFLVTLIIVATCRHGSAQTKQSQSQQEITQRNNAGKESDLTAEREERSSLLVRKYAADASLNSAGHIQFIWLNPELIDSLIDDYGTKRGLSAAEIEKLKNGVKLKLNTAESYAFLVIFRPNTGGFISQPYWVIQDGHGYPEVYLRGSRGQKELPYKWEQILGDREVHWYSNVVWGYLLFKARAADGHPMISADDFSFSVQLRHASETTDETLYDTSSEFHYDLMPVQLQSLVDSSIPSWNNSLVTMREQRNGRTNRNYDGTPAESYDAGGRLTSTQNNAVALSKSDVFQILGLALQFAEFIVKVSPKI